MQTGRDTYVDTTSPFFLSDHGARTENPNYVSPQSIKAKIPTAFITPTTGDFSSADAFRKTNPSAYENFLSLVATGPKAIADYGIENRLNIGRDGGTAPEIKLSAEQSKAIRDAQAFQSANPGLIAKKDFNQKYISPAVTAATYAAGAYVAYLGVAGSLAASSAPVATAPTSTAHVATSAEALEGVTVKAVPNYAETLATQGASGTSLGTNGIGQVVAGTLKTTQAGLTAAASVAALKNAISGKKAGSSANQSDATFNPGDVNVDASGQPGASGIPSNSDLTSIWLMVAAGIAALFIIAKR